MNRNNLVKPKTLLSEFATPMLDDCGLSDLVIVCQGNEFPVHKIMLAGRSEVFKRMLTGDYKEAREGRIELKGVEPHVVKQMIKFIYHDEVAEDAVSWQLFELAEMYDLTRLQQIYLSGLCKNIGVGNCCKILDLAFRSHSEEIFGFAIEFLKKHKNEVAQTEGWEQVKNNKGLIAKIILHVM
jgi:speckle-type POZ protein